MKIKSVSACVLGGIVIFAAVSSAATPTYVGSRRCKACHLREYRSWEKTTMARTFELLRPGTAPETKRKATLDVEKDYTHEPKCVSCHVTGFGKPGGFVSIEQTPELAGVQCEECHGAASEYLKAGGMTLENKHYKRADLVKLGLIVPNREACASACHNEHSPFRGPGYVFVFEEREAKGAHEIFALKYKH